MNRKGATGTGVAIVVGLLLLAVFGGAITYFSYKQTASAEQVAQTTVVGGTDCNTAPTITVSAVDALQKGTTVTKSSTARVNGEYVGSIPSTLKAGDKVELKLNASNYIDSIVPEFKVGCGNNLVNTQMFATDAVTLKLKDDATTLTDTAVGGANNMSALGLGGTDTVKVVFTGIDKKSSGDLVYVVEMGSNANVSDISMYDLTGKSLDEVDVPSFYVNTLASPAKQAFIVPAVVGAKEIEYKLTYTAKSGKDIRNAVYTTAYSEQAFVDTDGTFKVGVEDSLGNTKYEDTYDYDFWITP